MRFKDVANNSKIRELGSLFRGPDGSGWRIEVRLTTSKDLHHFKISDLFALARGRMLNPTTNPAPAGYPCDIQIVNTATWAEKTIGFCPIPYSDQRGDAEQWCFVFEHNGITHYLPQIELARVLFLRSAYLAPLSLAPGGLSEDFDAQRTGAHEAQINILPTCTLASYARSDHAFRRALAWILLDGDARRSFESIATNQLRDGEETDKRRSWRFRFNPPELKGVKLRVRGHFDKHAQSCLVYEIHGLSGIPWHGPPHVTFCDPRYHEGRSSGNQGVWTAASFIPEPEIDSDEVPNSDRSTLRVIAPPVEITFSNPFSTSRTGRGKVSGGGREEEDVMPPQESAILDVSTDEASVLGAVPAADYDGLEDKSDDAHLYAKKFEAFKLMAAQLVNMPDCLSVAQGIRKLPRVKKRSKHLLADGSPRCTAFHFVMRNGTTYALLEVDVSDSKDSLSTLLLKEPEPSFDWDGHFTKLEMQLVNKSLAWPTEFLNQVFGSDYRRIAHPTTSPESATLLKSNSIHNWAKRVYSKM